jgi:crossover junction endodeoxyribonuclease RusA
MPRVTHRFALPFPPSANDYWTVARGRIILTAKAREYKERIRRILIGYLPIEGPVIGEFRLYRPRRVGDLGNGLKVVEDALNGIAYLDDKQIDEYRVFKRFDDPKNPRVELVYEGERFCTRGEVDRIKQERLNSRILRLKKRLAGR